ncbi:hypothetical protein IMG5_002810 [Ichthyophthirius multifiliis]|uniref:Phosphodiesterase n=1 Tax=Ichthyophthirius multifiliis TaxID=5932 RepID=G0QJ67_ICHMU|nr:hypothetical protein IMG5_002810 [Ichthyophthirius multifiliis]EGR34748.1 hypothetical protein IMG5_002810 [Ichthyophthirius multifiliis]|eukprot:XP_004040052.1 hypothetical protein IMG5_002810 [Ichthyophthirius multifiliis]
MKARNSKFINSNNLVKRQPPKDILKKILISRIFDNIIIFLVIIFTIIIFVYFAIDTRDNKDNQQIQYVIQIFQNIEMALLILFCLEIFLKIYAFSYKVYFKDKWLFFDTIIMILSILILVLDIVLNNTQFTTISKIIRGIFRFMRLFLVFRKVKFIHFFFDKKQIKKVNQFKAIQITSSNLNFKSSIERIIEIMKNIKNNVDDIILIKQIDWCIQMIQSNKIYDPIFTDSEAAKWVNIYENTAQISKKKKVQALDKRNKSNSQQLQILQSQASFLQVKYKDINIPTEYLNFFEKIDLIDFEVFQFHEQIKTNNLSYLLIFLFQKYDINNTAKIDPTYLWNWANHVSAGYKNNSYHNNMHAFDVTQTVHFFLQTTEFINIADLKPLEIGIMYLAAACHDYEHPGFNNPFLINSKDELAIRYNDKSPLENHHSFSVFYLMTKEKSNVFVNLNNEEKKNLEKELLI